MISTTAVPRTRRLLLLALVLSILIHLFGGGLWGLFSRFLNKLIPPPVEMASRQAVKPDTISLERAAKPKQAHDNRPKIVKPIAQPPPSVVPAAAAHHEIVHVVVHAPQQTARATQEGPSEEQHAEPAPPPSHHHQAYSDQQLAQMGEQFAGTIASSHQDANSITDAAQHQEVATMKHYTMPAFGYHEGLNPGDGRIQALSHRRVGDKIYYWTHYEVVYADGHYEADDIPWEFIYPVNDDPFARGDKRIPLQEPPPGFTPNRELKPVLKQFFGGPPVDIRAAP